MTLYDLLLPAEQGRRFEIYLMDASGRIARVGHGTRRELMDEDRDGHAILYLDHRVTVWYPAWNGSVVVKLMAKKKDAPDGGWDRPGIEPAVFGPDGVVKLPESAIRNLMADNDSDKYAAGYRDALMDVMKAACEGADEERLD